MFTSVKSHVHDVGHIPGHHAKTVIARGVKVEGDFVSQGDVLIDGEVHGSFSTTGQLTVGAEATIAAHITAGDASIAGTIQGNVTVAGRVDLSETARVWGDIHAQILSIAPGAILQGGVSVGQGGEARSTSDQKGILTIDRDKR